MARLASWVIVARVGRVGDHVSVHEFLLLARIIMVVAPLMRLTLAVFARVGFCRTILGTDSEMRPSVSDVIAFPNGTTSALLRAISTSTAAL